MINKLQKPKSEKLILHIKMDNGEIAKAMLIEHILLQMSEIEYEMDKLFDFGKFPDEAYKQMWELLKRKMVSEK